MNGWVGLNPTLYRKEVIMRSTKQLSITLPVEMANRVKDKVSAGEYTTESEVIRDGIRALLARDRAIDSWLTRSIAPIYDATKENPARGVSAASVRERLAKEHEAATSKK